MNNNPLRKWQQNYFAHCLTAICASRLLRVTGILKLSVGSIEEKNGGAKEKVDFVISFCRNVSNFTVRTASL